jgi:non-ribosomal peptide synthetase component F
MCGVRPGTPLFDVLFVWQQSLFSDVGSPQVEIVNEADKLDYKLTLAYQPMGDHVQVKATYDPSVIPESQVQHLLHQIDDIVRFLLLDSHKSAADVVECFSPQHLSIANPNPIFKRFTHGPAYAVEQWAQRAPEREALIFGTAKNGQITATERLTYAALNGCANKLAHALAEQGARNNELICVIMEKSLDLYVAILAVLKLGCGYLPIVPDSPAERASKIVGEARVSLCISDTSVSKELLSQLPCTIFHLDWSQIWGYPEQDINTTYDGSRLAYAVFTSGSTGKPKGVLVTQDNLMSNLDYLHGRYPTSETSRLLQACSQAFDVSVFEIFFAWYAGICLCSAKKDDLFCDLEQAMNTMRITHLSLTPTVASLVNPRHVPSIEFLVTAGEALTEHVRRQWAGKGLYQGWFIIRLKGDISNECQGMVPRKLQIFVQYEVHLQLKT